MPTKDWWASKAMWGSVILTVTLVYNMIASRASWPMMAADPETIGQLVNDLVVLLGLGLQIVGRITADTPIDTKSVAPGLKIGE